MLGIPVEPRMFNRASKASPRCCNSAMMASRVSRLAVERSRSVSMHLVYHNQQTITWVSHSALDHLATSSLNCYGNIVPFHPCQSRCNLVRYRT